MPPKKKAVAVSPIKREKKSRATQNAKAQLRKAAQQLNIADLHELLQTALRQQGSSMDPGGYAYVSVEEGSNYAPMETQDPLAKSACTNTFLEDLTPHLLDGNELVTETEGVPQSKVPEKQQSNTKKALPQTTIKDSIQLVAQKLSVAELRAMLQAAIQHEELNSAASSQGTKTKVHIDETQEPLATTCMQDSIDRSEPAKKQQGMHKSSVCGNGMVHDVPHTPVLDIHKPGAVVIETIQRCDDLQDMLEYDDEQKDRVRSQVFNSDKSGPSGIVMVQNSPLAPVVEIHKSGVVMIETIQRCDDSQEMLEYNNEQKDRIQSLPLNSDENQNGSCRIDMVHNSPLVPVEDIQKPSAVVIQTIQRCDNDSQDILDYYTERNDCVQSQVCNLLDERRSFIASHLHQRTNELAVSSIDSEVKDDWQQKYKQLEKQFLQLSEKHKKCKQKYAKLEADKLTADDYSLRMGKELMQLKDKHKMKMAQFTEENGIPITIAQLEELNGRAGSDSLFVGLLSTFLIGTDRLEKMSVTGKASHRFSNVKNPDGSPKYPAAEGVEPKIIEFIANKVAERVAIAIGPDNIATIRKRSELNLIKKFIGQKIANLRKAAEIRKSRNCGSRQDLSNISNI